MSRLDWFTIAVVGICLAAIVFLLSRAMNWNSITGGEGDKTELQEDLEGAGLLDDDTIDPDSPDASDGETTDSTLDGGDDAATTEGIDGSADDSSDSTAGGELSDDDGSAADEGANGSALDEDAQINTSPSRASGDYLVIAGSFSLMHNAENFAQKLQRKGYPNAYVGKFNAGKFASVIVDSFDSSSEASAMVKDLKAAGIEAFSKRQK